MKTFRALRRVLAFDTTYAALPAIAHAGFAIDLIPSTKGTYSTSQCVFPPLYSMQTVGVEWAQEQLRKEAYDCVLCATLEDLQAARGWDVPTVFVPQAMLGELAGVSGMARLHGRRQLEGLLEGVTEVFLSESQRASWLGEGVVIPIGVHVDRLGTCTGHVEEIAWTGVDSASCALREGHGVRDELTQGVVDLRKIDLRVERGMTWDGWLEEVRAVRAILCTESPGHGMAPHFFALCAMGAGVPLVSLAHEDSPIADGENGYVSNDYDYLRQTMRGLLMDENQARLIGARGRDWIAEYRGLEESAERWRACIEGLSSSHGGGADLAQTPRVSIIMPLYNKAEYTEKCLYALAAHTGEDPDYEVIIVDNASSDWTKYLLLAFEGDVEILRNDENVGFARANNQGARSARGEYVLFLNNDTEPFEGWLREMVQLADSDERIGVVGARLLYPQNDTVQHAGLEMINGIPDHVFRGVAAEDDRVLHSRDLDMVTGACMLVRRTLFEELGGFDEAYRNGVEDVDLCLQVRSKGYRVVYCAESVLYHHEGTSEGRFDHVNENLQRFFARWQGRFDGQGRFRVDPEHRETGFAAMNSSQFHPLRGYWEGPFFVYSSLAHVNREMALELLSSGNCDLGLIASEPDTFSGSSERRFAPIVARMGQAIEENVDFHIRHRWPPDVARPAQGKLVLIQPWEYGRILKSWVEPMQANVDQIWAYTSYVRQVYIDSGFDPDRVKVVPLGIDDQRFKPGVAPMELSTGGKFAFLFVGGTLQRKGIDLLLEAFRSAFSRADNVCLVIKDMGNQTFYRGQTAEREIAALQQDEECAEIIYLDGDLPAEDIPGLYAACDCLVHPYRGEGFGLPVAEAMACGLPVVVTEGGACDDFCNSENAFMVPAQRRPVKFPEETVGQAWMLEADVQALAAQMRQAFEQPERAREMGRRGAKRIARDFTWKRAAEIAHDTLMELCRPDIRREDVIPLSNLQVAEPLDIDGGEERLDPLAAGGEVAPAAIIALGGGGAEIVREMECVFEGTLAGFDVGISPDVGLGDQLEVIREKCNSPFVVVIKQGVFLSSESMRLMIRRMEEQPDIVVAEPLSMVRDRGVGVEEVEKVEGQILVFRREALDAIGGFDRSFSTVAALDEVVRQLRRQGGRAVRMLECRAEGTAVFGGESERLAADREREAIEALDRGDQLRGEGQRGASLDAYRLAVEKKDDFVEALIVLAAMLIEEELAGEAVEVLQRLVALDEHAHQSHNYLGMARHRSGDRVGARASFERAYELKPDSVETLVNLSVFEWEEGQVEAAVSYLEQAAEFEPDNRDVIVNTAVIQVQTGHVEDGMRLLDEHVAANESDVEAVCILADIYWQQGGVERAKALAESALSWHESYAPALSLLEKIRG